MPVGKLWEKNMKFFFGILKISEERSRISGSGSINPRIRGFGSGSGSAPKCHGSPTLLETFTCRKILRLCASSLSENVCKNGRYNSNHNGVGGGYVHTDNRIVVFHILNRDGVKEIFFFIYILPGLAGV